MSVADWAEDDEFIDACLAQAPKPLTPLYLGRRVLCHNCGHTQHAAAHCPDDTCECLSSLHTRRVR